MSEADQRLEAGAGDTCGRAVCAGSKVPVLDDAQKVIDDPHWKIGQLQGVEISLPGSPPSPHDFHQVAVTLNERTTV